MNCDICKAKIGSTILAKIRGTFIKVDGKKKTICHACQSRLKSKEDILKELSR